MKADALAKQQAQHMVEEEREKKEMIAVQKKQEAKLKAAEEKRMKLKPEDDHASTELSETEK